MLFEYTRHDALLLSRKIFFFRGPNTKRGGCKALVDMATKKELFPASLIQYEQQT